METQKKVIVTVQHVFKIPEIIENNVLYISNHFETCIHLCLCGCKTESVTPYNIGDKGWVITENENGVSITPSILNPRCPNRSHYFITDNVANFV